MCLYGMASIFVFKNNNKRNVSVKRVNSTFEMQSIQPKRTHQNTNTNSVAAMYAMKQAHTESIEYTKTQAKLQDMSCFI